MEDRLYLRIYHIKCTCFGYEINTITPDKGIKFSCDERNEVIVGSKDDVGGKPAVVQSGDSTFTLLPPSISPFRHLHSPLRPVQSIELAIIKLCA